MSIEDNFAITIPNNNPPIHTPIKPKAKYNSAI